MNEQSHSGGALARPDDAMRTAAIGISSQLTAKSKIIQSQLPPGCSIDRFKALCLTSFARNSALLKCAETPKGIQSLLGCVYQAAQLGLEPDTAAQDCHIIPYKGVAQFILGYRGLLKLVRRAMPAIPIWTACRREDERFEISLGTSPSLVHEPGVYEPGEKIPMLTHAYACARLAPDSVVFKVVDHGDIDRARASSQARKEISPWTHHEAAMWEKTALKRLCKVLPMPDSVVGTVVRDDMIESPTSEQPDFAADWREVVEADHHEP